MFVVSFSFSYLCAYMCVGWGGAEGWYFLFVSQAFDSRVLHCHTTPELDLDCAWLNQVHYMGKLVPCTYVTIPMCPIGFQRYALFIFPLSLCHLNISIFYLASVLLCQTCRSVDSHFCFNVVHGSTPPTLVYWSMSIEGMFTLYNTLFFHEIVAFYKVFHLPSWIMFTTSIF